MSVGRWAYMLQAVKNLVEGNIEREEEYRRRIDGKKKT